MDVIKLLKSSLTINQFHKNSNWMKIFFQKASLIPFGANNINEGKIEVIANQKKIKILKKTLKRKLCKHLECLKWWLSWNIKSFSGIIRQLGISTQRFLDLTPLFATLVKFLILQYETYELCKYQKDLKLIIV